MIPVAVLEVLQLPFRQIAHFPLPAALACLVRNTTLPFTLAVSREAPRGCQAPYFVGPELDALALAAEHDRARWVQMDAWARKRLAEPTWRLTPREAIGGLPAMPTSREWTTVRVLRALGVRLLEVHV